jgi:hypothetical protein
MSSSFEEKQHSYAEYLKKRLRDKDLVPDEVLENLSDEEVLESYRKDCTDGHEFYTREAERQVIMETENNDGIYKATENLKHMNHIENVEKEIIKEFSSKINSISVKNVDRIKKVLDALNKDKLLISIEDIDEIILFACSLFPEYILEGAVFETFESEDAVTSLRRDYICAGCLLKENVNRFKTLTVWALNTLNGNLNDDEDGFTSYFDFLIDRLAMHIAETIDYNIQNEKVFEQTMKRKEKEFDELLNGIAEHLDKISLISCWVYAKDKAQEMIDDIEEQDTVLQNIHDIFCEKYSAYFKNNELDKFLKDVKDFLNTLTAEQVEIVYDEGFPVEMAVKWNKHVDDIVEKIFEEKVKNEQLLNSSKS